MHTSQSKVKYCAHVRQGSERSECDKTQHCTVGYRARLITLRIVIEEHFPSLQRFDWRTISVSACEGSMLHEGEEGLSRKLVRVKGESFEGWGCSDCAWVFIPSGPPVGRSLDEMKRN